MFLTITQILSSFGIFASRAFLPAFIAAVVIRYGGEWAVLQKIGLSRDVMPPWFTHNLTIAVLGGLAALEFLAHRNGEARKVLAEIDHWAKPVMAALVTFGLLSADDSKFAGQLIGQLPLHQAGLGDVIPAAIAAMGAFWGASLRNAVLRDVQDADPDDDTGLQRLFSWAEDLWAGFGIVLMLVYPLLMAALVVVALGTIYWLRSRAEEKEEAGQAHCAKCGVAMYRSAMGCPSCHASNPRVHRLTWLGTTGREPVLDLDSHPILLATKKRCPRCATRLRGFTPDQACRACGLAPFGDPAFVARYDRRVMARLPFVLTVAVLLSAVPVVGLVPGVILYRLQIVAPFRRYIPRGANLLLRWALRLLFFVLAIVQLFPAIGAVTVPLMALANWAAYRGAFMKRVRYAPSAPPTAVPA
jgi:Zn finger protein HypA/HybF involved in hydrogenase expression